MSVADAGNPKDSIVPPESPIDRLVPPLLWKGNPSSYFRRLLTSGTHAVCGWNIFCLATTFSIPSTALPSIERRRITGSSSFESKVCSYKMYSKRQPLKGLL